MSSDNGHQAESDQESTVRPGRQAPYKRLPDAVMDDDTISPEAKLTYWYLMRIAGYSTSQAKVSLGRIAEKLGRKRTNRNSPRRWIGELAAAGWIDVHERRSPKTGARLASEYVVHEVPPEHPGSPQVPPPRIADEPAPGSNLIPPPGYLDEPASSRGSFDVDVPCSGTAHNDARASCPSGDRLTTDGAGTKLGQGVDDLFASWSGLDQEQSEDQDLAPPLARNGASSNGTSRGSGAGVTRTKRSSSRAALPPQQVEALASTIGAWADTWYDTHGVNPTGQRRSQAAREIRALIVAGNDPARVLHAARAAARAGYATIEQQLVRMTSTSGGRAGRMSATELPRDDWRRFTQE